MPMCTLKQFLVAAIVPFVHTGPENIPLSQSELDKTSCYHQKLHSFADSKLPTTVGEEERGRRLLISKPVCEKCTILNIS